MCKYVYLYVCGERKREIHQKATDSSIVETALCTKFGIALPSFPYLKKKMLVSLTGSSLMELLHGLKTL